MAIAHIGTDSKASVAGVATLNVTKPTAITPGASDRLTLVVQAGNSGGAAGSYTEPSGWTLIGQILNVAGGGNISLQAWHAAGDVSLLGFTRSGSVTDIGWVMACFSGVDTTTPIDATGTPNSLATSATLTTNGFSIVADQSWHCIAFSDWNNGVYSATGFTVSSSPTSNDEAALLYNTTPKSTGPTGTVVVSDSAGTGGQILAAVPFALRPAGAGAPAGQPTTKRFGGIPHMGGKSGGSFRPGAGRAVWERSESGLYVPNKTISIPRRLAA